MQETLIGWSGLSGKTGMAAMRALQLAWLKSGALHGQDMKIVMGLTRNTVDKIKLELPNDVIWRSYTDVEEFLLWRQISPIDQSMVNVLVDFSHASVFDQVLDLAVKSRLPLVSGTSGLSEEQMAALVAATAEIPIFRGGNFQFTVKYFIDEVVQQAEAGHFETLYEKFFEGKLLPSETSKVIYDRIKAMTGREIEVKSSRPYSRSSLICDWQYGDLHCRTEGFDKLACNVLEIAKVMVAKPVQPGVLYDINRIWDDLMVNAPCE